MSVSKRLFIVAFTAAVTAAFVAPVSVAYLLTKPRVDLNEQAFLMRSVLAAAGIPVPASPEEVVRLFKERVEEVPARGGRQTFYRIKDSSGALSGYVFLRSGPGLWGEITAAVGFDRSLEKLTGVDFLKQSETPGLGARISEAWFREQFRGKRGPLTAVAEGQGAGENQFDGITGATLTTNFVRDILNASFSQVKGLVD
jgi:Na+-transporting NADH:ubiquinone oxidoreductase subunit C